MSVRLTAILDLTEQVQAAIDGGDWQSAQELEEARRAAIVQLVAAQPGDTQIETALAELYARNQRMLAEVDEQRRQLLRAGALLKTGQAALAAYGDSRADSSS